MKRYVWFRVIVVVSVVLFVLILFKMKFQLVEKVSNTVNDSKFKIRTALGIDHKPDQRVVIVDVDELSINKLGRWPWDRRLIAKMIENLVQANVVGLDIVFSEPSNAESDKILAETISKNGNVILGFFFRDKATENVEEDIFNVLSEFSIFRVKMESSSTKIREFQYIEANIPEISKAGMASAFFSIEPDVDGLYRNYPLGYISRGVLFPSMGFQLLRFYTGKDIEVVLDDNGFKEFAMGDVRLKGMNYVRLNYYDNVSYVSAYDVITGKLPSSFFKDKIVIVGITEVGVFDLRPTPIDPVTPGVSLHYTLVSNILKNDFLVDKPLLDIAIIILLPIVGFGISFITRLGHRIFLYIIISLLILGFSNTVFILNKIWLNEFYHLFAFVLVAVATEALLFFITDQKSLQIKKAFSTYVSPEVVELMLKDPDRLKLGGENREVTIIFTDIRGFTTLSEKLSSEQVVYMLNQLNTPLTRIIIENGGLLDKYIGDAIMAIFNAPVDIDHHPDRACRSALLMYRKVEELSQRFQAEGLPPVKIGIGINTGEATVGNIGSDIRFDYTAIGDSVNLASRLEGLNKYYKTHIIVSESTKSKTTEPFLFRIVDKVVVKGKTEPISIFELMEKNEDNLALVKEFELAYSLYLDAEFRTAKEEFGRLYEKYNDGLSEYYNKRCEELIALNIEKNSWNGVYIAKEK
ncbi:MAG: adenylate/guanylate cyclase domain-containing protein [Calditerrivibrio sp.]|nr:adenylate/guanylate cyclase domain-containing protein [Calditerrivibrio sp.]